MRRYRSLLVSIAGLVVMSIAVSGCTRSSAVPEILAKARAPLQGEEVDEYAPAILQGRLAKAIGEFGVGLLARVADNDKNVVVSPFSAYSALGLAQGAADGETLAEMKATLKTTGMAEEFTDPDYADMLAQLRFRVKDTPARLDIANSIWLRNGFEVSQDFIERDTDYFGAQVARIDMRAADAPDVINAWVRDNTGGKIDKLIERLDPGTDVVLCNAVFFKDAWWTPFEKSQTQEQDFRLSDGSTVQVPTMAGPVNGSYIDADTYQAVALPTKGGAKFWILVPKDGSDTSDVLAGLGETYRSGRTLDIASSTADGRIFLPKFDIAWKGSLNEPLKSLGMVQAFDRNTAEFPRLTPSGQRARITEVVQAATTTIDEEGFEAAAATEVGMAILGGIGSEPFEIRADRPFVYAITMGDLPLFIGVVNDPRQK